ncbi:MAG: hypothetical protein C4551_10105 [Bacillota bacterium]|nr:MAG: hypothetical protein C4551_10105 [Bacillota bacterium]
MTFSYDLSTTRGKVRLLVKDTNYSSQIFQDDEVDAFLTMESNVVKRAAALALETIASDEALTTKVIRALELSMDGPAVARALMQRADKLREQADKEEAADEGAAFDVAEMVYPGDTFGYRERLQNEVLRDG